MARRTPFGASPELYTGDEYKSIKHPICCLSQNYPPFNFVSTTVKTDFNSC